MTSHDWDGANTAAAQVGQVATQQFELEVSHTHLPTQQVFLPHFMPPGTRVTLLPGLLLLLATRLALAAVPVAAGRLVAGSIQVLPADWAVGVRLQPPAATCGQ